MLFHILSVGAVLCIIFNVIFFVLWVSEARKHFHGLDESARTRVYSFSTALIFFAVIQSVLVVQGYCGAQSVAEPFISIAIFIAGLLRLAKYLQQALRKLDRSRALTLFHFVPFRIARLTRNRRRDALEGARV
ncbi:MAG: hypothetical protein WC477_00785 [Patescibacteria group bacterium]